MRRFLRIFPLYYAVLGFILVILPHWVKFDPSAQSIVERQAWLWTYLSNSPWAGGGWNDSNQFLLGHFWSLCVEEHFYLVWPVVILTCKPEWVATTCLLLLTASLGRRVLTNSDMVMPAILSWTSISRLDGLFVGSLIAVCCRSQVACLRLSQSAGGASIVMGILFLVCVMLPRRLQNGLYFATFETITVFFFGSIATLALRGSGWIHSSMQNSFLRSFGKYSYGIYVIHFICLPAFERLFRLDYLLKALGSPLVGQFVFYCLAISSSYLLAFASWHLMEKHFLSYKRYFDYKTATAAIRA